MLVLMLAGVSCMASYAIEVDCDFYTAMSQYVFSGRDYLLTSNSYAKLDFGDGPVSYETLLFIRIDSGKLPDETVDSAWLKMVSGPAGSMGSGASRPIKVTVHNVDLDVMGIKNGKVSPKKFYVEENHILNSYGSVMVYQDGVCYWDVTELVNQWILYKQSDGSDGLENLGIAITGREDEGALNSYDNQHTGFYSSSADELGAIPKPHSITPALIITEKKDGFGDAWVPSMKDKAGYTYQQWLMSASAGRCDQGMLPDGKVENEYGDPNIVWQEELDFNGVDVVNPFLAWHPFPDQSEPNDYQPVWVDGVYGGVFRDPNSSGSYNSALSYSEYELTATIPTGSDSGELTVFVQCDWYDGGNVNILVDGAVDITPLDFEVHKIGNGQYENTWYRTTKVFRFDKNPGVVKAGFVISGDEPWLDSVSVFTAQDIDLPEGPLRYAEDIDMDGYVNLIDFAIISNNWLLDADSLAGDCDGSEYVDQSDIERLSQMWLMKSNYIYE